MIRVKQRTLKIWLSVFGVVLVGLAVTAFFMDNIKINIPKEKIETVLSEKIPMRQKINIAEKLPTVLSSLKPFIQDVDLVVHIDELKTKFSNDNIEINVIGKVTANNEIIPFNVLTNGKPEYREESFFFKANDIKINTKKEPSELIKQYVLTKLISKNEKKIDDKIANIDKQIEDKLGKYSGMFGAVKEKLKEQNIVPVENISASNVTKTLLTDKVFNNPEYNSYINNTVDNAVKSMITSIINNKPLYVLKDSGVEKGVKVALKNILISENGVVIEISLGAIAIYIFEMIIGCLVVMAILYLVARNPGKTFVGIFEVMGTVTDIIDI